ncbi:MAG: hypothetical protein HS099_23880 [Ardenticatenaceae bacterium]|nr:hypothetical protein [Ardenticatenaceae bacterium]
MIKLVHWRAWRRKPHWLKWQRRARAAAANTANNLLPLIFTPVISLLVIRQSSAAQWGAFVAVLVTVQLGAHIVAWGNQEYLLREFSRAPARIAGAWQSSLLTRSALLACLALTALWLYPGQAGWIIVWGAALVWRQSFNVLVTYKRDFTFAALVEVAGLAVMITAVFLSGDKLATDWLIRLFALTALARSLVLLLRFRWVVRGGHGRFYFSYFRLAFPFFLLGFAGMLNSRLDLYLVSLYLPAAEVGSYQVFANFLLYLQSLAAFMLLPFVKSIYRVRYPTIRKISLTFGGLGLLIVPPAMILLYALLTYLYGIHLPPPIYLFGALAVWPIFFFLPVIYALYKAERETAVLQVNAISIGLALCLNLLWLPRWGMLGVVIAMATVKWVVLFIYLARGRRLLA